jgi:hypothetical protein
MDLELDVDIVKHVGEPMGRHVISVTGILVRPAILLPTSNLRSSSI